MGYKKVDIDKRKLKRTWPYERLRSEALKYKSHKDFLNGNPKAYQAARKRGPQLMSVICSHMTLLYHLDYTDEELHKIAKLYMRRSDFSENERSAYMAARKRGKAFLDEICSHMDLSQTEAYSNAELRAVALLYNRRNDFNKNNPGAYNASLLRGKEFHDSICSHMKKSSTSSKSEREILLTIKTLFSKTHTLKDRKVKIEGKPYIHGFDIDIFIPELNLGIEFDGTKYHSFEHMRKDRSKKLWSDHDILNYHEIKDTWFLSKDIKILHIKEEDWNNNRSECITKIECFLKICNFMLQKEQKAA